MVPTTTHLSPNHYAGHAARTLIGIHTMEAPEAGTTAENVASYFAQGSTQASAHWCVDSNSRVRCVNDENSAWTMPPTNRYSLNVEIAGYAGQSATDWNDAYSLSALDNAAFCVAEWCHKYEIPVRHLTDSQIAAHEKGISGHVDVNRVFHASSHTDPGQHFPWDKFLGMVRGHLGVPSGPGTTGTAKVVWPEGKSLQRGDSGDPVEALQQALAGSGIYGVRGISVDGDFGPQTQTAVQNFEANQHLTVDSGIAGKQVRDALIRLGRLTVNGAAV